MRTTFSRTLLVAVLCLPVGAIPAVAASAPQQAIHKTDALHAKLSTRVKAVDAKLAAARNAGRLSPADANQLKKKLAWVRTDSARYVKQQGFLSAGESASYNRALDAIEAKLG